MINSRKLDDLLPVVKKKAEAFLAACKKQGIDVLIYSTYRDHESQAAIFALGRTVKGADANPSRPMGRTVTKAGPGQSWHNFKCAFDFVPLIGGKEQWNNIGLYQMCGRIAVNVGLEWGGDWTSFVDRPHCQYTGGLTMAQLRAGEKVT